MLLYKVIDNDSTKNNKQNSINVKTFKYFPTRQILKNHLPFTRESGKYVDL